MLIAALLLFPGPLRAQQYQPYSPNRHGVATVIIANAMPPTRENSEKFFIVNVIGSPTGESQFYSVNMLGNVVVVAGRDVLLNLGNHNSTCLWDFRVTFNGGWWDEFYRYNVCNTASGVIQALPRRPPEQLTQQPRTPRPQQPQMPMQAR